MSLWHDVPPEPHVVFCIYCSLPIKRLRDFAHLGEWAHESTLKLLLEQCLRLEIDPKHRAAS